MKRPRTRVEEVRQLRGLTKAELARRAGMLPQTLQRIEDGSTKSLSLSARRLLAPALRVRDDQLMMPIGYPIEAEMKEMIETGKVSGPWNAAGIVASSERANQQSSIQQRLYRKYKRNLDSSNKYLSGMKAEIS